MSNETFTDRWDNLWEKYPLLGFAIIITCVGWFFMILLPSTARWSGEGEVSIFPSGAEAKNYRLIADIDVSRKLSGPFSYSGVYEISHAYWPNGGWSTFSDCTVKQDSSSVCTTDDGDTYRVEVSSPPDRPETDSSS